MELKKPDDKFEFESYIPKNVSQVTFFEHDNTPISCSALGNFRILEIALNLYLKDVFFYRGV